MKKFKKQSGMGPMSGVAVLGERGQIVIPKNIRNQFKLKAGDNFMVIGHMEKIMLVPQIFMTEFVQHISKEWNKVSKKIIKSKK